MYYDKQPKKQREEYKRMLKIMGSLSRLFSDSDTPYLQSRAQENIFSKYFEAQNISRADCSADAKKGTLGIGLKTWMGQDNQKIAEFGKNRKELESISDVEIARKLAEYRNRRIKFAKKAYNLEKLVYHIVKRVPGSMKIYEHVFDYIDEKNISIIPKRGRENTIYFTDGKNIYNFNKSKTTLYMLFNNLEFCDEIDIEIMEDPFSFFDTMFSAKKTYKDTANEDAKEKIDDIIGSNLLFPNQICLRLYKVKDGKKYIPEKSGLNQWNAAGRARNEDEIYIPYPKIDRNYYPGFFPDRDTCFKLHLPAGKELSAKVCQQDSKAIMSNPNKDLGHWLLRDVLELPVKTLITYDMLEIIGIDAVIFTKNDYLDYSIDFASVGTYERIHGITVEENV